MGWKAAVTGLELVMRFKTRLLFNSCGRKYPTQRMASIEMSINQQMTSKQWAQLAALSFLWGGSFFFVGIAIKELPPFTIVMARLGLAALILLVFTKLVGFRLPTSLSTWKSFFVMGLIGNVIPFSLIVWGQSHIASGVAAILNAATPLFTVLVAHFLTSDEKMSANKVIGVIIGFCGVAIMIGPAALLGSGTYLLGQLAIIGATISYGFAGVYGRKFKGLGMEPAAITTCQITAAALLMLPLCLLIDQPWTLSPPSLETWASLFGIAALSTALAYLLFFALLGSAGATNLSLVTFLVPVSAILLGVLILGERLEPKHFAGMALIAAGLAAIDGRLLKRLS